MHPPSVPLATADTLSATQIPGSVTLKVSSSKPTPGHQVRFVPNQLTVFPPEYRLLLIPPSGIVNQVITPFAVEISFATQDVVSSVTVFDAGASMMCLSIKSKINRAFDNHKVSHRFPPAGDPR